LPTKTNKKTPMTLTTSITQYTEFSRLPTLVPPPLMLRFIIFNPKTNPRYDIIANDLLFPLFLPLFNHLLIGTVEVQ
jgi:hypothetical protein